MLKRTPIRKKSSRRKMMQQLDLVVRGKLFERDGNKCQKCLKRSNLQAAHVLPKGKYPRLRWYLPNLLTLCYACHLHWAHKDPLGFSSWFMGAYPDRYKDLNFMRLAAEKVDVKEALRFAEQGLFP